MEIVTETKWNDGGVFTIHSQLSVHHSLVFGENAKLNKTKSLDAPFQNVCHRKSASQFMRKWNEWKTQLTESIIYKCKSF